MKKTQRFFSSRNTIPITFRLVPCEPWLSPLWQLPDNIEIFRKFSCCTSSKAKSQVTVIINLTSALYHVYVLVSTSNAIWKLEKKTYRDYITVTLELFFHMRAHSSKTTKGNSLKYLNDNILSYIYSLISKMKQLKKFAIFKVLLGRKTSSSINHCYTLRQFQSCAWAFILSIQNIVKNWFDQIEI